MKKGALFSECNAPLSIPTLDTVKGMGFAHMTPVQASTIPLFLQHKDVCVEATTGSGKTLAFGIPIFEMLSKKMKVEEKWTDDNVLVPYFHKHDVGALVVAPTRELAVQIYEVLHRFSAHHTFISCALFIGGTSIQENATSFVEDGGQVIIGTPGRIIDLTNRLTALSSISYKKLEVLILDEADKLLDMGFKESINQIFTFLPKQRRTGLFSATQTREVKELARAGLRNPVTVSVRVQYELSNSLPFSSSSSSIVLPSGGHEGSLVGSTGGSGSSINNNNLMNASQATPSSLANYYLIADYDMRPFLLYSFILEHLQEKMIIFCATCACVDYYSLVFTQLYKQLHLTQPTTQQKVQIIGFHGKMLPKKRSILYKKFKALPCGGVMFSTDVAARGIDIPDVDWILQMAAPKDPAFFVHRVGRTARAGKKGGAILMISQEEEAYIALLQGRGVPLRLLQDIHQLASSSSNINISNKLNNNSDSSSSYIAGVDDSDKKIAANVINESTKEEEEVDIKKNTKKKNKKQPKKQEQEQQQLVVDEVEQGEQEEQGVEVKEERGKEEQEEQEQQHIVLLETFKSFAKKDRMILEAGSSAYIAFLRAYKEHLCAYIFRLEQLDLGALARAYGLLRLPKIAETRGKKGKPIVFTTDGMDTALIPFKHPEKEAARLRKVQAGKDKEEQEQRELNGEDGEGDGNDSDQALGEETAADGKVGGGEQRSVRTTTTKLTTKTSATSARSHKTGLTQQSKKPWIPKEEYTKLQEELAGKPPPPRDRKKRKTAYSKFQEEWEELQKEENNFKRFKAGKISKEKYEKRLLKDDDEKDDGSDDDSDADSDSGGRDQQNKRSGKQSKGPQSGGKGRKNESDVSDIEDDMSVDNDSM